MAEKMRNQVRRRPLESYSKPWLGFVAIAVVAVLIGAMLLVESPVSATGPTPRSYCRRLRCNPAIRS